MKIFKSLLILVLLCSAVLLPLSMRLATGQATNTGWVRLVHAAENIGPVDIYINGAPLINGLAFHAVIDYLNLPTGEYRVVIRRAGDPITARPVLDDAFTLEANHSLTVLAYAGEDRQNLRLAVLQDDRSTLDAGTARISAFLAAPDSSGVDIIFHETGGALMQGIAPEVPQGTVNVPAGLYDLDLISQLEAVRNLMQMPEIALKGGTEYLVVFTLWFNQATQQTEYRALWLEAAPIPEPTSSQVSFVHAAPGVPPLDIYVNGNLNAASFDFGDASVYMALPPYEHTISIFEAGFDEEPILEWTLPLGTPDTARIFSFILTGTDMDNVNIIPIQEDVQEIPPPNIARLRFLHAVPDVRLLNLEYVTARHEPTPGRNTPTPTAVPRSALFANVNYEDVTDYADIAAGTYMLDFVLSGSDAIFIELADFRLWSGRTYTIILAGDPEGAPPVQPIVLSRLIGSSGGFVPMLGQDAVRQAVEATLTAIELGQISSTLEATLQSFPTNTPRPSNTPAVDVPRAWPVPDRVNMDDPTLTLNGADFPPSEPYSVFVGLTEVATGSVSFDGTFEAEIAIPRGTDAGPVAIRVCTNCGTNVEQETYAVVVLEAPGGAP